MIKQLILSTAIVAGVAHGATDNISSGGPILMMNDKVKYDVWNPPMGKKESGECCKDGNCVGNFSCIKKDGRVYKFFRSLSKKVVKNCKKL
ncbi:MAG: hypothetical protein KC427_00805 [Sulfurovum sp.]|uniref:hypothetical protein n=1 Tax=Sulfurovum sp. TaxID=1969726 RepID=UPI0028680C6E|nr:hypothetical protein [Sulfurovum sp.]MCO4844537.1 hypothetical protein [Sulfurovum sp.]